MEIEVKPGKYVVAVSGGVDSVVLLDLLCAGMKTDYLVVAHFDHGIRETSNADRKFVESLAKKYEVRFFYEEGHLGPDTGEALARQNRYEFLEKVKNLSKADAIITAHHRDDLLETIAINILRGTGRKGLSSLKSQPGLLRPLLGHTKKEILDYARQNKLQWHEDETNTDEKYLRNYVRHNLMNKLSETEIRTLLKISSESADRNRKIDDLISKLLFDKDEISRNWLASLSHKVANEVVAQWLRNNGARLDKKTVERLVIKLKTAEQGKKIQANNDKYFVVDKGVIRIKHQGVV